MKVNSSLGAYSIPTARSESGSTAGTEGRLDDEFWAQTLAAAVRLRREILHLGGPNSAYRLVASESDGLSGLTVDRYDRWLAVQFTRAWPCSNGANCSWISSPSSRTWKGSSPGPIEPPPNKKAFVPTRRCSAGRLPRLPWRSSRTA